MSKNRINILIIFILLLIILINCLIALIFFKASGYKMWWEKVDKSQKIPITEVSIKKSEINYNKIDISAPRGIIEVFESIFVNTVNVDEVIKLKN